jgi:hypothetical protein
MQIDLNANGKTHNAWQYISSRKDDVRYFTKLIFLLKAELYVY